MRPIQWGYSRFMPQSSEVQKDLLSLFQVKIIKVYVAKLLVDVSFDQLGGVCTLCFLEEVPKNNFLTSFSNQSTPQFHAFAL